MLILLVSIPVVSLSASTGRLFAGGVTTLNCSATLNTMALDEGLLLYSFNWTDREGVAIVSGGRTNVIHTHTLLSSSSLTLSPLSITDTNFTCSVFVMDSQNTLLSSGPGIGSILLNVEGIVC